MKIVLFAIYFYGKKKKDFFNRLNEFTYPTISPRISIYKRPCLSVCNSNVPV